MNHFSEIANKYRDLRTTDPEPVASIARRLWYLPRVKAVDIGCGAGRYDLLLCKLLGAKLYLTCVDPNHAMREALDAHLKEHGLNNFAVVNASAESLPFLTGSLDCVFTFNAVHHFDLVAFVQESARVLRSRGYLFIYTRLQEQNRKNIWGRFFPDFCEKETRLYDFGQLLGIPTPELGYRWVEYFRYQRSSTLEDLVARARAHHYSTFSLYAPEELEEAIRGFEHNIKQYFGQEVNWVDENVLVGFVKH